MDRAPAPVADDFHAMPFARSLRHHVEGANRLVSEASDWGMCRAVRMRLEEQLALQEEFRILDADRAEALRTRILAAERRFGDLDVERVLRGLQAVTQELYAPDEEHQWW